MRYWGRAQVGPGGFDGPALTTREAASAARADAVPQLGQRAKSDYATWAGCEPPQRAVLRKVRSDT